MVNEVSTDTTFEQNIMARLREDVGKLMPDDKLAALVEEGVKAIFFAKRQKAKSWGGAYEEEPSWFEKEIEKLLRDRIVSVLNVYIKDHGEELVKIAADSMAKAAPNLIAASIIGSMTGGGQNFAYQARDFIVRQLNGNQ